MQDDLTAAMKENLSEDYFRKWAEELDVREPLILFEQEEEANMIEDKIILPENEQLEEKPEFINF